jgi:phosphatidylinositol-3-phosphatase
MKIRMTLKALAASLLATTLVSPAFANEGNVPKGVPRLDHVFVIVMENHAYGQIVNNPNAPFTNQLLKSANSASNYFGVAHPSLTNYLEIVGGSNFSVLNDNDPDWHNSNCITNLSSGQPSLDDGKHPNICPIWGNGTDAATPAKDYSNETSGQPGINNIDGVTSIDADKDTSGKTIGDQLADFGRNWKSYQENLPPAGADLINYSDGFYSNKLNPTSIMPKETQGVIKQYAAKHNPFVYFRSVQEGIDPRNSLSNVVGFEGPHGLFEDLNTGRVPEYSLIAPNQCNDQHGRGNAGPACDYDPVSDGTQNGLNPALIYQGDLTLRNLVKSIHDSPAWKEGRNAIVIVWDENDYSVAPNTNNVVLIVDTNYGKRGVKSSQFYTHFSLLKSVEAGLHLPCLNHACDSNVKVMSDLFAEGDDR